ncbi:uncharacterized protein [Macrobrachium rosenbergii]|uniref:uncharacterized protein n=1 Tax=Macrobrachium rosenbergii TaxID=79674 RepID=UPI0034D5D855
MKLAITAALSAAFVVLLVGEGQGIIMRLMMSDDCFVDCMGNSSFCGSDGRTYDDCSIEYLDRCIAYRVKKIYDGPCSPDWNGTYGTEEPFTTRNPFTDYYWEE